MCSPGTVQGIYSRSDVPVNVASSAEWRNQGLSVSMARESNGRDRWLTVEEEGRVLAACGPWLRDMVQFALELACGWEKFCHSPGAPWI